MGKIKYVVKAPPDAEPVTLTDAKEHLRLLPGDTSEDAAIIVPLIRAAREYCERYTGRALAMQTISAYPTAKYSVIPLPMPPIIKIDSVKVYLEDGTEQGVPPSSYVFDVIDGRIVLYTLPQRLRAINPIEITYQAGYENMPMVLRQAMLLMIAHWYENREAVEMGAITSIEVSKTTTNILNMFKVWWF